ncbi:apolipoprotein N-acyltransferase [Streptomyces sp. NPDC050738]|uniref:apolipoprotein N-acyltransferase n=1 Tax=Streptomyces sp. NPDC050738 TaxID=3154744 RepID=UPI00342ED910
MSTTIAPVEAPAPPPAPVPRYRKLVRPALAAVSGLLLYASFPPRPLWWLAPFAFALFGLVMYGRRARAGFGLGYLAGLGFLLPLLVWTGVEVGPGPWLGLAAVEALFVAAAGAGIAYISRLPLWPLWASGVWIAVEAARARFPFGGFPWGKIAFGQPEGVFLPLAAVGGTPLLGFAVVLCGFGIGELVRRLAARRRVWERGVAGAALLAAVPVAAGLAALPLVDDGAEDGTTTVGLIQGNVPRMGLDFASQRRAVLDYHVKETMKLAADVKAGRAAQPDLVLWPENSSDIDPYANADAYFAIDEAAKAIGAPISVGAVVNAKNGDLLNEQILWDPKKGPTTTYDKRQLQPFGEYMPYRSFFRNFSSDVDLVRQDFTPGKKSVVFDMAGTKIGPVTCYEAAFDWAVRDQVKAGAQIISVPSNNATFDRSEMTYQQLAMSRVRAVEHSRAVMVPVTTGVTAVIRPDGSVAQKTKMFTADALVAEVPKRSSTTPATELGTLPEWLLVAIGVGGLGWAGTRTYKARKARG